MATELPSIPNLAYITLPTKPDCPVAYAFNRLTANDTHDHDVHEVLIIFVNGLGLPQTFWQPTIELLRSDLQTNSRLNGAVSCVTYDRYGQGLSQPAASTTLKPHTILDSTSDLYDFMSLMLRTHYPVQSSRPIMLFVAHSIGVPLTRLYLSQNPSTATGCVFLDSNMANTDFVSILPDPDSPSFSPEQLPSDTTIETLRWTRSNYRKMFHPMTPNPERLDRSNIPSLLPSSSGPKCIGPDGNGVHLTVVGHDPDTFAEESLKISTRGLTERYMQPAWEEYNRDLLQVGGFEEGRVSGVVIASHSGHFVQRDNPRCVADEILGLAKKVMSS